MQILFIMLIQNCLNESMLVCVCVYNIIIIMMIYDERIYIF
jgi:hypothetical protein